MQKTCIKSLVTEIGMCYQVKTTAIVDNTLKLLPFNVSNFYSFIDNILTSFHFSCQDFFQV